MDEERKQELEDEERENNNPFVDWFNDNKDWIKEEYKDMSNDYNVDNDETGLREYAYTIYRDKYYGE